VINRTLDAVAQALELGMTPPPSVPAPGRAVVAAPASAATATLDVSGDGTPACSRRWR
jgi:hypothetical protein